MSKLNESQSQMLEIEIRIINLWSAIDLLEDRMRDLPGVNKYCEDQLTELKRTVRALNESTRKVMA